MEGNLNVEIGQRLRTCRKKMGMTQEMAAEMLGMSATYYGEIERGKKALAIPKVVAVYEKMGLTPTYLLTGKTMSENARSRIFKDCPLDKTAVLEQILYDLAKLCK